MKKILLMIAASLLLTSCATMTFWNVTSPDKTKWGYIMLEDSEQPCFKEKMRGIAKFEIAWSWILLEIPFLIDYLDGFAYYYAFQPSRCMIDQDGKRVFTGHQTVNENTHDRDF